MTGADDKLVRVRGGPKGFRLVPLSQWKDEVEARRGKNKPAKKLRRETRMEAKQNRRNKGLAKKRANKAKRKKRS